MDIGKVAGGSLIIGLGLASPIPVIDDVIGIIFGVPMILDGLGAEEDAKELKEAVS